MTRTCGSCNRCCDGTLSGSVKGHDMYPGKPCFFLQIGGVCSDYENRPQKPCVEYSCLWIDDDSVPDFIKPENSNAILDINEFEGKKYLRLTKSGVSYDNSVLEYAIDYAKKNNMSLVWVDEKQGFKYYGDAIFCLKILLNNSNKYEQ
jgi:hypothetical protein